MASKEDENTPISRPEQPTLSRRPSSKAERDEQHGIAKLSSQIRAWINAERAKRTSTTGRRRFRRYSRGAHDAETDHVENDELPDDSGISVTTDETSLNDLRDMLSSSSLDHLEHILTEAANSGQLSSRRSSKRRSLRNIHRTESEAPVEPPSCEVTLELPDKIGKDHFKQEVLRLAHTLGCKGWRKIPLDDWEKISISRISGALTNSVFGVTPPKNEADESVRPSMSPPFTAVPLLLRIYGAQVSHLIDRDTELAILRRLARQKIGPRLLGTFTNGRFEQFFDADTLTKDDIRNPVTSTYIAKRMCEMHQHMEVEKEERNAGSCTWKNWRKWKPLALAIDEQKDKHVLGYPFKEFAAAVDEYIEHVENSPDLRELVFAHNDAQYGNILRKKTVAPDAPPHKSLIVIDFEYAGANTKGYEFANHFCEWMANYHAEKDNYTMHESQFPTLDEMKRFCTAYLEHVYEETEKGSAPVEESKVMELVRETILWVPASHAVWCAWGIVQAKAEDEGEVDPADFDYIGYARERAALFWGDIHQLGLIGDDKLKDKKVKFSGKEKEFQKIMKAEK